MKKHTWDPFGDITAKLKFLGTPFGGLGPLLDPFGTPLEPLWNPFGTPLQGTEQNTGKPWETHNMKTKIEPKLTNQSRRRTKQKKKQYQKKT